MPESFQNDKRMSHGFMWPRSRFAVHFTAMDDIDRLILGLLVEDGRMSISALADEINLSASATSERVKRLERTGVIAGYAARLNPAAAGRPVDALIEVRLEPDVEYGLFDTIFVEMDEIVDAMHMTGSFDYLLRVRCGGIEDLEDLLRRIKDSGRVRETITRIALRTIDGFPRQVTPS